VRGRFRPCFGRVIQFTLFPINGIASSMPGAETLLERGVKKTGRNFLFGK